MEDTTVVNPWTGEERNRGLRPLEGAFEAVLERVTEGRSAAFEVIKRGWPDIVSAEWIERSRPIRLEGGVLTIEVSDGGAASRLRLEQRKIREALDQRIGRGEVAHIRLRVGRRKDWSTRG